MHPSNLLRSSLVAATCSFGLALGAFAQTAGTGSAGTSRTAEATRSGSLSSMDNQFVTKAAMGGLAEVELGKLAQQKATSAQVKTFAEQMVQDHSKANDELKALATSKGVQVPADLGEKHKAAMQKLQKLSGEEFDREYMKHMVADHRETVADFKKQAESGNDAELKSFAASKLSKLEEHRRMAESTSQATKGSKS